MAAPNGTLTIVIADDDADDRSLVIEALDDSQIRHRTVEAKNGLDLLKLLENRGTNSTISEDEPDLVLLDLNMPMIDGFAALKHIKTSSTLKSIPVYVLTTSGDTSHIDQAFYLGADGYYRKTMKFSDLVDIVIEVCSKHKNPKIT